MWRLIRDGVGLDLFDLNYSYSSEKLGVLGFLPREELPRKGALIRVVSFFLHFLWALVYIPRKTKSVAGRPVVFFATTMNQRDSLLPVARHVEEALLVCTHPRPGARLACDREYPMARAYLLALPFFPLVLRAFWRARGYRRESFSYWLDEYWLSYGHYLSARLWLRRRSPRAVVSANDHNMMPRTFVVAARDEGIPTIYLQHGAGSTRNPPLVFRYAFLDGRDSLGKFEKAGPSNTRVFLVGKPRSDDRGKALNASSCVQRLGICTNYLDPVPRVEEVCRRINGEFPDLACVIRPHPRDHRRVWAEIAERFGLNLSNPREESPFAFLQGVDAIIAGDSSIHVEAALMNVYPVFFDFAREGRDSHDFQEAGLIEDLAEVDGLAHVLRDLTREKPDVRARAKPFIATVDTPYDGRSGQLAGSLIRALDEEGNIGLEGWRRIPGVALEAYELGSDTTFPESNGTKEPPHP